MRQVNNEMRKNIDQPLDQMEKKILDNQLVNGLN